MEKKLSRSKSQLEYTYKSTYIYYIDGLYTATYYYKEISYNILLLVQNCVRMSKNSYLSSYKLEVIASKPKSKPPKRESVYKLPDFQKSLEVQQE